MFKKFSLIVSSLVISVVVAGSAFSQSSPSKFPNIKISNFGKMDDRFYRGAQPKKDDYAGMKALGIQTIIDLQEPGDIKSYEKGIAESLGMKYINIPIKDAGYPTDENVAEFLKTVDDPATGVFYVHCAGGRHRTGDMGALYRYEKYGWDFDKVYQEMENFDFYTRGHQKNKDFVVDYGSKMTAKHEAAKAATAAGSK